MNKFLDGVFKGAIVFFSVFFAYVFIAAFVNMRDQSVCLENNFRSAVTTWDLKSYCTARLEGSDIVVPLEVVKNATSR